MWSSVTLRVVSFVACAALATLVCHGALADSLDGRRIAMIDAHALAAPPAEEASPSALARYLSQPARDDTEKARAIFRWVADRISYDVDAYFLNRLVAMNAEEVLNPSLSHGTTNVN